MNPTVPVVLQDGHQVPCRHLLLRPGRYPAHKCTLHALQLPSYKRRYHFEPFPESQHPICNKLDPRIAGGHGSHREGE